MTEDQVCDSAQGIWNTLDALGFSQVGTLTTLAPHFWLKEGNALGWGAFMMLFGPTRKQLLGRGIVWHGDATNVDQGSAPLFTARMLLHRGLYAEAMQILPQLEAPWQVYIESMATTRSEGSESNPDSLADQTLMAATSGQIPPRAMFLFATQLVRLCLQRGDKVGFKKWSAFAIDVLSNFDSEDYTAFDRVLGRSRLARYVAPDDHDTVKKLSDAVAEIEAFDTGTTSAVSAETTYQTYLLTETKRRILDQLIFHYWRAREPNQALPCAIASSVIDPNCSRARMVLGDTFWLAGDVKSARREYFMAFILGPLERTYCGLKLASLTTSLAYRKILAAEIWQEYPKGHHAVAAAVGALAKGAAPKLVPPITVETASSAGFPLSFEVPENVEDIATLIQRSPIFGRVRPFFELEPADDLHPVYANGPLLSYQALAAQQEPWFVTITLQRAMIENYRRELSYAIVGPLVVKRLLHEKLSSFAFFGDLSTRGRELKILFQSRQQQTALQRALLARTLSSLGFFEEALTCLDAESVIHSPGPEGAYESGMWIFVCHIARPNETTKVLDLLPKIFQATPKAAETLRNRLVLAITGCVLFGRAQDAAKVGEWRNVGLKLIEEIKHCPQFSSFEQALLESRFYRAASFGPFIAGDRKTLTEDAHICEDLARNLRPSTPTEEILKRENLFPMLESMSRTWKFLGDNDRAEAFMREIVAAVDPEDSKAWLQVGEFEIASGRTQEALACFLRAAECSVPMTRIAWYRAGRCYEKLGEKYEALWCYWRSYLAWPAMSTSMERIHALSSGVPALRSWAKSIGTKS